MNKPQGAQASQKAINTNPFARPISHALPKRLPEQSKSKTMIHQPEKGMPLVKQDVYKDSKGTPYVAALNETNFTRDPDG